MPWNQFRYQYTGQMALSEAPQLKLYYYKARMYSSVLGRFLQTDPIGYDAGPNLYAYVLNDPVNRADRLGLDGGDEGGGGDGGGGDSSRNCGFVTGSHLLRCGSEWTDAMVSAGFGYYVTTVTTTVTSIGGSALAGGADSSRPLSELERAFYALQFPDYVLSQVILATPMPWWVDESRFQGITLHYTIYVQNGLGSLLSSAGRAEFGGHELAHVWQFSQGMTITDYLVAEFIMGYPRNPSEVAAQIIGFQSRSNYCSAIGGPGC